MKEQIELRETALHTTKNTGQGRGITQGTESNIAKRIIKVSKNKTAELEKEGL